jgi:hypothetical protein
MALTTQDNKEHSIGWALRDGVMLGVQTIPASINHAAEWFTTEFGGYAGYCTSVVILPLRDPQFVSPLLPKSCCNAQERARYRL